MLVVSSPPWKCLLSQHIFTFYKEENRQYYMHGIQQGRNQWAIYTDLGILRQFFFYIYVAQAGPNFSVWLSFWIECGVTGVHYLSLESIFFVILKGSDLY